MPDEEPIVTADHGTDRDEVKGDEFHTLDFQHAYKKVFFSNKKLESLFSRKFTAIYKENSARLEVLIKKKKN